MGVHTIGGTKITSEEAERLAVSAYRKTSREQPASAMTEVFNLGDKLFVRLANCNGHLATLRVVADGDRIMARQLDEHEAHELSAAV